MTDLFLYISVAAKALFVALFPMILAVVLTWADRRQGAMIQDRVGPNRAVVFLKGRWAAGLAVLAAIGVSVGVLAWASKVLAGSGEKTLEATVFLQLAILATWGGLVALAGSVRRRGIQCSFDVFLASLGDPRRIAMLGLLAHLLGAGVEVFLQGSNYVGPFRDVALRSAPAVFAFSTLGTGAYAAWWLARFDRVGLRLAGLMHPAADGIKAILKEDFIPRDSDRLLHGLAPLISFFPVLVVLAVVPFGDALCLGETADWSALTVPASATCGGGVLSLQVLDIDSGLLFYFALAGTGIIGAALGGFASNNKYSLMGALRATSQMVSYEVALGLTLVGLLMIYGTLRVDQMVEWQRDHAWGLFVQPVAFVLFFAAAVAESKRIPFDLPEGESEIVAGYFTEYSGMKFAMFFFAEYVVIVTSSALMVALFLGGWHLPFLEREGLRIAFGETVFAEWALPQGLVILLGFLGFIGKVILLCSFQLLIRWTLPRFRYDQLMALSWRRLLPASLVNILVTGVVVLLVHSGGSQVQGFLQVVGDGTELLVALSALGAVVALVIYALSRPEHKKMAATSIAQFGQILGGSRLSRMGA